MEFTYFPIDLNQLPATITYHDLTDGIHTIGGARVATQFLNHPAMTVGYRVEADDVVIVYLVDHEPFSDELWRAGAEPGHIESILHEGDRRHAKFMSVPGHCRRTPPADAGIADPPFVSTAASRVVGSAVAASLDTSRSPVLRGCMPASVRP